MAQTSKVTREYILSELDKHLVRSSDVTEDEITSLIYMEHQKELGKIISREFASRFLRRCVDDGIMTMRVTRHNGHSIRAYRLKVKGNEDG